MNSSHSQQCSFVETKQFSQFNDSKVTNFINLFVVLWVGCACKLKHNTKTTQRIKEWRRKKQQIASYVAQISVFGNFSFVFFRFCLKMNRFNITMDPCAENKAQTQTPKQKRSQRKTNVPFRLRLLANEWMFTKYLSSTKTKRKLSVNGAFSNHLSFLNRFANAKRVPISLGDWSWSDEMWGLRMEWGNLRNASAKNGKPLWRDPKTKRWHYQTNSSESKNLGKHLSSIERKNTNNRHAHSP